MTRRCELMGTLPLSGQLRSHAENKTKRKFRPNLCNVTLMSDVLGKKVRLRVSARALKSVEHRGGLDAFLLKAKNEQLSPTCLKLKREIQKARPPRPPDPSGVAAFRAKIQARRLTQRGRAFACSLSFSVNCSRTVR